MHFFGIGSFTSSNIPERMSHRALFEICAAVWMTGTEFLFDRFSVVHDASYLYFGFNCVVIQSGGIKDD